MSNLNTKRLPKSISPTARWLFQARTDLQSVAHSLSEAAQHASDARCAQRLASLAAAAEAATEPLVRIARNLGARRTQ